MPVRQYINKLAFGILDFEAVDDGLNSCSLGNDWVGLDECLKRKRSLSAASNDNPSKRNAVARPWKHAAELNQ